MRSAPHVVHVRRSARGRLAWCGARPTGFALSSLDHAAELSSSGDVLQTCPACAHTAAAAVLAGAHDPSLAAAG